MFIRHSFRRPPKRTIRRLHGRLYFVHVWSGRLRPPPLTLVLIFLGTSSLAFVARPALNEAEEWGLSLPARHPSKIHCRGEARKTNHHTPAVERRHTLAQSLP
jgi:hypothetical protein